MEEIEMLFILKTQVIEAHRKVAATEQRLGRWSVLARANRTNFYEILASYMELEKSMIRSLEEYDKIEERLLQRIQ